MVWDTNPNTNLTLTNCLASIANLAVCDASSAFTFILDLHPLSFPFSTSLVVVAVLVVDDDDCQTATFDEYFSIDSSEMEVVVKCDS